LLHVTDGESVAGTLRESGLGGAVRIYGDLLYEGPAPAGLSDAEWIEARAGFLAQSAGGSLDDARRSLAEFEETLKALPAHDETVLWLDHRLSDQLILIRLLDGLSAHDVGSNCCSLISIGAFEGIDRFVGLGQLNGAQLASLIHTRQMVTDAQSDLGRAAWRAFTSPDPREIEVLLKGDTSSLPFLSAALGRHLEQFPSVDGGLSRTEREALAVLQEKPLTRRQLFFAVQGRENPLFMGEGSFFHILAGLMSCRRPLIRTADSGPLDPRQQPAAAIMLTQDGLCVLEGQGDHVRWNGIDRWMGGVHLQGEDAAWRWDRTAKRLIALG
jgi:Domain of unknown function (DUF1835)